MGDVGGAWAGKSRGLRGRGQAWPTPCPQVLPRTPRVEDRSIHAGWAKGVRKGGHRPVLLGRGQNAQRTLVITEQSPVICQPQFCLNRIG